MSSYLELLNLTREPFSNSPDPDAYYRTPTHEDCLNRLEIAIRLRRGLNVVLGEVGTGKSTLCRCLLRSLNEQSGIDVFLLLDAGFEDADEFVRHLCELFAGQRPPEGVARRECISVIQNRVFDKALEQNRNQIHGHFLTNVLIQALPAGITDFIVVSGLVIFCREFGVEKECVSTSCTILIAVVGFMILYHIAKPMTTPHAILIAAMVIGWLFCMLFFSELFAITAVTGKCAMLMIVFAVITEPVFRYLIQLVEAVQKWCGKLKF